MKTGLRGTYVISWSQTETDGFRAAPPHTLTVGSTWRWSGEPLRVDGPGDIVRLEGSEGVEELRRKAAVKVRRLIGVALGAEPQAERPEAPDHRHDVDPSDPLLPATGILLTDGRRSFTVTLIPAAPGGRALAMFFNDIPPPQTDLWVVQHGALSAARTGGEGSGGDGSGKHDFGGGVICFTPGTRIRTPDGQVPVEDLREGDLVQTKDNGPQEILWLGSRRMSGARLFAMPHLRPVRIRASAFGSALPDDTFLVSPDHRLILKGDVAQDLFGTPEVLVCAKHLLDGSGVATDLAVREVTYVHLLLPRHEVLFANGVESESFHPAQTALSLLAAQDRARLLNGMPGLGSDPHVYGATARRLLSASDAALLRHAA